MEENNVVEREELLENLNDLIVKENDTTEFSDNGKNIGVTKIILAGIGIVSSAYGGYVILKKVGTAIQNHYIDHLVKKGVVARQEYAGFDKDNSEDDIIIQEGSDEE